jgi:RNA polymerase sigma-32 factor
LCSSSPLSLSELGREFGISKQRVAQVEGRLKRRLKDHLSEGIGSEIDSILCDPPGWSHVRCTTALEKL